MDLFFLFKLLIVLFFLVMFLRRTNLVWGIGLLTATSALLLDTFLGAFGRDAIQAELGFFYHIISGSLFAGAALWLWGLLRPLFTNQPAAQIPAFRPAAEPFPPESDETGVDRQMLYEQIQTRLSPGDVRDLIFDLELNENDVLAPGEPMTATVTRLMDNAAHQGKMGALALAVERVLTPIPPENLPRREKLSVDSPPTVLRHYLLAHYSQNEIAGMATALDVDWERLDSRNKRTLARELLTYVSRRNRLDELIALIREPSESGGS
ncbi:MAG: hypothetical protein R3248_00890 [Candidatus Promineifilaceae bacterium]|nr:hypothetical protein [Candidatus Promineifilaceae bacterium]